MFKKIMLLFAVRLFRGFLLRFFCYFFPYQSVGRVWFRLPFLSPLLYGHSEPVISCPVHYLISVYFIKLKEFKVNYLHGFPEWFSDKPEPIFKQLGKAGEFLNKVRPRWVPLG